MSEDGGPVTLGGSGHEADTFGGQQATGGVVDENELIARQSGGQTCLDGVAAFCAAPHKDTINGLWQSSELFSQQRFLRVIPRDNDKSKPSQGGVKSLGSAAKETPTSDGEEDFVGRGGAHAATAATGKENDFGEHRD
jgi:hypothetical protein